jgi:hypothetical protein
LWFGFWPAARLGLARLGLMVCLVIKAMLWPLCPAAESVSKNNSGSGDRGHKLTAWPVIYLCGFLP